MASAQRCMNRWICPKIARARKREKERERESQIFQNPPKYNIVLIILTWCSYFCLAPGGLEQLNHEAAFWPHQANSLLMMLKAWWKTEVIVLTQIVNRSFGMPIIICKLHFFNNTTQSSTGMPGWSWRSLQHPATSLQCACRVAKDLHPLEFKKSLKELETIEAITKVPNPAPSDKPPRGSMLLCSATAPSNFRMLVSHISMFVQPIAWGWLGANTGIDLLVTKRCPPQQAWTSGISVDIPPDGSSTERGADSSCECARSLQLLSCFVKLPLQPWLGFSWHGCQHIPKPAPSLRIVSCMLLLAQGWIEGRRRRKSAWGGNMGKVPRSRHHN